MRIYISQDAIRNLYILYYENEENRAEFVCLLLVYRQDIIDLCTAPTNLIKKNIPLTTTNELNDGHSNHWLASVLILVPLRLGLNELDLIYEPYLKEALKLSQTVGIIGGSPRHAVYILGFQDESFIDLDPHFSQATVNVLDDTFDLSVRKENFEIRRRKKKELLMFRRIHVRHRRN